MSLVELGRYSDRIEATLLQGRLDADGIASFLFDAEMSWIGDALQCRLMVAEEDLGPAKQLLGNAGPE